MNRKFYKPGMIAFGIATLAIMLTSTYTFAKNSSDARSKVNSREFKVLLTPELFNDLKGGFNKITEIALQTADETGSNLKIRSSKRRYKIKQRKIVFYDTADHQVRKKGYALRIRTKYKRGRLKDSFGVTYKYRNTDPEIAVKGIIQPSGLFAAESKFEQDVTIDKKSDPVNPIMRNIYSKSAKIKNIQGNLKTVKDFAAIFKGISALNLSPDTKLTPVNNISFIEKKVKPGFIDFGNGIVADFEMSIWYKNSSETPTICEVSFDYDMDNYLKQMNGKASKLSEKFYLTLFKKLKEKGYVHSGSTKTDFTYGNASK